MSGERLAMGPGYYVCRHRTHPPEGRPRCITAPYVQQLVADAEIERRTLARLVEVRDLLADAPEPEQKGPDFEAKRANLAARRKRLVQAVAAGKLGMDDIDAPIAAIEAERADLEVAAAEHAARASADTVEGRRAALAFVDVVSAAWAGLTPGERRSVLAILAERIVLTVERNVEVTWRDASELSTSVASVRPELVTRLVDAVPAAPASAPVPARERARSRAAACLVCNLQPHTWDELRSPARPAPRLHGAEPARGRLGRAAPIPVEVDADSGLRVDVDLFPGRPDDGARLGHVGGAA